MEDSEDVSLHAIFKKKKSLKTKEKSTLRKSSHSDLGGPASLPGSPTHASELVDTDQLLESEGNVVISRVSKKKSLKKTDSSSSLKVRISLGTPQDESDETESLESRTETPRRKLLRPTSHASLASLEHDQIKDLSSLSTSAQTSRPTYSTSHLNELKSLTLSSSPQQTPHKQDYDQLTESKFASFINDGTEVDDNFDSSPSSSFVIPTSTMINSAKERRLNARKAGFTLPSSSRPSGNLGDAEEFISLSGNSDSIDALGAPKKGDSRLVREEDELGEGEEEHAEYTGATERVPLGKKAGLLAEAKKKAGMEAMVLETLGDMDQDDEELEWEAAQIRRGGVGASAMKHTAEAAKQVYRPASIPEHAAVATFNAVENRLRESLDRIQTSFDQQSEAAVYFATEDQSLERQESDLRQEVEKEAIRQQFFQELNTFVEDINSFFTSKWSALEAAEKDLLSVLTERTEMVYKRRYEDLSDDLALFKAGEVSTSRPVAGQTAAEQSVEDAHDADSPDEAVDELGRHRRELDTSSQAPSRRARREERTRRRKRRTERLIDNLKESEEEGYSTDDTLSPADSSDLLAASKSLLASSKAILADTTNPEFLSPTNPDSISDRFLKWKAKYPEEYGNAFGNLALVQVWEFWARIELVSDLNVWGFIDWVAQEDKRGIENWDWMRGLEHYDHKVSEATEDNGAEAQDSVIAAMITTVIIPVLIPIISQSYDPFSYKATSKSLELVEQVGYVLDIHNNPVYDQFVMSFLKRFYTSLCELQYLAGTMDDLTNSLQSQIGMEGIGARNRFLNKCYKLLKQGIRWKKHSKRLVFDQSEYQQLPGMYGKNLEYILSHLLVGQIMIPILNTGWETGGKNMAEKIVKACPFGFLPARISEALHRGPQA
ncbi:nineteen complex-related protein 2-domain-containing protein [Melampsora americana]|nr:nineteen complex-related protein 2-domain-containing protein [Melampsora americana]